MNRYKGLMRDTWWLWLLFFGAGIGLALFANALFLITIPVLIFACIYYVWGIPVRQRRKLGRRLAA